MPLIPGAVTTLVRSEGLPPDFKPVVQVFNLIGLGNGRFRLILSDGQHYVKGLLAAQVKHLVDSGQVNENSIVQVNDFMPNVGLGRTVIIVLEMNVIASQVSHRIGNPTDVERQPATQSDGESEEELLDWRMNPADSHSDWTVALTCKHSQNAPKKQKANEAVFHVHKCILAVGSRRSEYFERLFQSEHFQEAESSTSRIALDKLAFEAFPSMLDYMYKPSQPLSVTAETATALHHLGAYFGISRLQRDVEKFVKRDRDIAKYGTYYEHATALNNDWIMEHVENGCIENTGSIEPSHTIIKVAGPQFWLTVFQRDCEENSECYVVNEENDSFLRHVSELVAEICHQNEGMSAQVFQELTEVKHLPVIVPDAALRLLVFESKFVSADNTKLSSLAERCIEALVQNWLIVDFSTSNELNTLGAQRPALVRELLTRTVKHAKTVVLNL